MTPLLKECEEQAMQLSRTDRAALAHYLIVSLDEFDADEHERLWVEEAGIRYEAYKRGELTARPMEDVLRDARARL